MVEAVGCLLQKNVRDGHLRGWQLQSPKLKVFLVTLEEIVVGVRFRSDLQKRTVIH